MKKIKRIVINGSESATLYYQDDRLAAGSRGYNRQIRTMTKIISLDKLAAAGALNIYRLEEEL